MSKKDDLIQYQQGNDEIERQHQFLKDIIHRHFREIDRAVDELSEKEIDELIEYIRHLTRYHDKEVLSPDASLGKIKALILLSSKLSDTDDADRILSYLELVEFGWHGNRYYLSNPCLKRFLYDPKGHCKKADKITSSDLAIDILSDVSDIFLAMNFLRQLSSYLITALLRCIVLC